MIRVMTAADYPAVYGLWAGTPGVGLRSLDDSAAGVGRFLERNPGTCFVAEEGGEIIGCLLAGHDGRRGHIYHVVVREGARGRGVGRDLVAAAEGALRGEGIHKAGLVAYAANEGGNGFWERAGYAARGDLVYRDKSLNGENR